VPTALADLRGVWRLLRPGGSRRAGGLGKQVRWFAAIGVVSTLAYLGLYDLLRSGLAAEPANALALLATTAGNTVANRRLTFGRGGRDAAWRDQAVGLLGLLAAVIITTGGLGLLQWFRPTASRVGEMIVLVLANGLATVVRFLLLRAWMAPTGALQPAPPAGRRWAPGGPPG